MLDGIGLLDDHDSACHCQMFSFFRNRAQIWLATVHV